jgi:hypothetical protein
MRHSEPTFHADHPLAVTYSPPESLQADMETKHLTCHSHFFQDLLNAYPHLSYCHYLFEANAHSIRKKKKLLNGRTQETTNTTKQIYLYRQAMGSGSRLLWPSQTNSSMAAHNSSPFQFLLPDFFMNQNHSPLL